MRHLQTHSHTWSVVTNSHRVEGTQAGAVEAWQALHEAPRRTCPASLTPHSWTAFPFLRSGRTTVTASSLPTGVDTGPGHLKDLIPLMQ